MTALNIFYIALSKQAFDLILKCIILFNDSEALSSTFFKLI